MQATVKGKITKITGFGALVSTDAGKTGLMPISEISSGFVKDIRDYLSVGQEVEAAVISTDENGRLSLSLRRLAPKHDFTSAPPETVFGKTESGSFEDMMHRFKTISDDKLGDLKHGYESKRGKARKR